MDIKDLAGLSEPLKRLVEVISDGIGAVCGPYLIRRRAAAQADEIRVISEALERLGEADLLAGVYKRGPLELWNRVEDRTLVLEAKPIEERAGLRREYQERKRQRNLEAVTTAAAGELAKEKEVPSKSPDEDWVTRFFGSAQEVSSEKMQDLWGRILAGEIKKPGSYSVRTLEFIRNLTTADAKNLESVGRLGFRQGPNAFVPVIDKEWLKNERDIHPYNHFILAELGVLYPTDLTVGVNFGENQKVGFRHGESMLIVHGESPLRIRLPAWKFTGVGQEILPLIRCPFDVEFLTVVGQFFLKEGCIKAEIGRIVDHLEGNQLKCEVVKTMEPEGEASLAESRSSEPAVGLRS